MENQFFNSLDLSGVIDKIPQDISESHGQKYEIVSIVAYLIGVPISVFRNEHEPPQLNIYDRLNAQKNARIIRHLCIIRTQVIIHFLKICVAMQREHRTLIGMPNFIPHESMNALSEDDVDIYKNLDGTSPSPFFIMINGEINSRINNCRGLFPHWINFEYIRKLFIIPNGDNNEGTKAASRIYYDNQSMYPYQQYIVWNPVDCGNLLYNDKRFVTVLYEQNMDEFRDFSLVSDVTDRKKADIYTFLAKSQQTVFIVDCENSDPYALCATIKNLDRNRLEKIKKVILYDDIHAASAWESLARYIDIPVDYARITRLKDEKSLADIKIAARTCREYYQNNTDSFVLVSSDSDYWGLIEELPEARFFVMIEHHKTSPALKESLIENGIKYCYIDDFYSGNGNDLKMATIRQEFNRLFEDMLSVNLKEEMKGVLKRARIDMSPEEQEAFLKRYIRNALSVKIDEEDNVKIECKARK